MSEDNMLRHRPFPSKDCGDESTTEHSPFSIFRSRALSSPIEPADIPNFRKKFVWSSIRLTRGDITSIIIINQTHYEKSDWSRAFNQFTIACELDMINVISATDIEFIKSSSTSAWLLSPLECSPQKQNRPNRLTQCCTQFKSPGVKILCVSHLH